MKPEHNGKIEVEGFPVHESGGQILITIPEEDGYFKNSEDIGFQIHEGDLHIIFEYKIDGKKFQDHHIISDKSKRIDDVKELWEKAGMNPQSRDNKILLPTEPEYHPTRSIHKGRHWNSVSEELAGKMNEAIQSGKEEGWGQEQYKNAFNEILKEERENLRSGKRALNKNMREWSDDKGRRKVKE